MRTVYGDLPQPHAASWGYKWGCRCDECKRYKREQMARYRKRLKEAAG